MAVCTTIYPLLDILWWNLLGQWMKFVYGRGYTTYWTYQLLPRFAKGAPTWFTCDWTWAALWDDNLEDCDPATGKCRPNTAFALYFWTIARNRFEDWIKNAAGNVARPLADAVANLLGSLLHGYTTFSTWIETIRNRVGTFVPWWTSTLAAGLDLLRNWLPSDIVSGLVSFYDKFLAWYEAAKSWAETRYEATRTWVTNTGAALVTGYNTVRAWYDLVSTWVTTFKNDPYGTVAGWLGTAWLTWTGIYGSILDFYNTVWVPFKITLHDFLADPLMWMYDRVEDELIRRW